jgi:thymidylate kinase
MGPVPESQVSGSRVWSDVAIPVQGEPSRHPFLVIEGLDGAGKSSVAAAAAALLDGTCLKTPPDPMRDALPQVDAVADPQTRLLYLLAGVSLTSQLVQAERTARAVVCDRYLYSALAYTGALDPEALATVRPLRLATPDVVVYLHAPDHVRRARLARRPLRDVGMDAELRRQGTTPRVERLFASFGDITMLSTDGPSVAETATHAVALLDRVSPSA